MKAVSGQIRLTGDALFQEVSTSLKLPPINVDKYEFISVIDDNCSFPDTVSGFEKIDKNKFIHHGSFDHPIAVTFFHESEYRKDILQKSSYISINFSRSSNAHKNGVNAPTSIAWVVIDIKWFKIRVISSIRTRI